MNGNQRPVINLYGNEAIIDTGAVIPMISLSPELITLAWKAKLVKEDIEIGGIGGLCKGNVYELHDFRVGELIFDTLDVFVADKPDIKYSFLLSATMFYNMNFSFDMIDENNQSFTVKIPDNIPLHREFKIKMLEGKLYAQVDGVLLQDVSVPAQDITNYMQMQFADEYDDSLDESFAVQKAKNRKNDIGYEL